MDARKSRLKMAGCDILGCVLLCGTGKVFSSSQCCGMCDVGFGWCLEIRRCDVSV